MLFRTEALGLSGGVSTILRDVIHERLGLFYPPEQFDQRLAEGDRRSGVYLYRTECPTCRACQPIRLDIAQFRPDATQRRMQRKGDEQLTVRLGAPIVDRNRVRLFNLHRDGRGLRAQGTGAAGRRGAAAGARRGLEPAERGAVGAGGLVLGYVVRLGRA